MAKHIHIHLLPRKTRDAGWDESKHKRDHGQFAAGGNGGSSSGTVVKHQPSGTAVPHQAPKGQGQIGDPKFHEVNYHVASAKNKELFEKAKVATGANHPAVLANHSQATAAEHHARAARAAHRGNTALAAHHHEQALQHEAYAAKHAASSPVKKSDPLYDKPAAAGKEPSDAEMKKHPNYNKDDHEYLKGKGWTNSEIHQRWTAEHSKGQGPAAGKGPKPPDIVGVVSNPNLYKGQAAAKMRQQEIDRMQAAHAKKTGQALPRHMAALQVANKRK